MNILFIIESFRKLTIITPLCVTPPIQTFVGKLYMIARINSGPCLCRHSNDWSEYVQTIDASSKGGLKAERC